MLTLTSIAETATYLTDRTLTDNVADELAKALKTATVLISNELGAEFSLTERERVFDVTGPDASTPGAMQSLFTQPFRPSFDLRTTSKVNNLEVRYRDSTLPLDDTFSWDDARLLSEPADYVFNETPGEITLRFAPVEGLRRIRARFTEGYASTPEILYGAAMKDHLSRTGAETAIEPLSRLVMGLSHKDRADAPSVALQAGETATLDTVPPEPVALHRINVHAPQNAGIVSENNPLKLRVFAGTPLTLLRDTTITTPLPGQTYRIELDPSEMYSNYRVQFQVTSADTLRPSLVEYVVADAQNAHLFGSVPPGISTACAMLAVHIYRTSLQSNATSEGKKVRAEPRGPSIPAQVARLLAPFKPSRVRFI